MTSPNPMALEAKALEAAGTPAAYLQAILHYTEGFYGAAIKHGMDAGSTANAVAHVERAARSLAALALPPPAAGEGLEPVAWRWRWSTLGRNTAWHFSPVKPGPFAEEGYEVQPLYAATQAARAAVLEEALAIVSVGIEALDGGVDAASRRYAAAIRALKEKT